MSDIPEPSPDRGAAAPLVPHAEFKAVLLLLTTVALIVAFVIYVMAARGVFDQTQRLVLVADDSEGVVVGMAMSFSGFPLGRVRSISLGADGKARIEIDVPLKDARWLRTSTVFTMERGMVGETRIRAFSNVLEDPPLPDNAERVVLRGDASGQIQQLAQSVKILVDNLERLSSPDSKLAATLANVQVLSERMIGPQGALGGMLGSDANAKKVIGAIDRTNTLLAKTDQLLAKTDQRVFGSGGAMDETHRAIEQLNGVLGDARESLKKADAVLAEVQAVGANARIATTDLAALRAEVDATLRKVGHLVDEVNRKWPFARDTEIRLP